MAGPVEELVLSSRGFGVTAEGNQIALEETARFAGTAVIGTPGSGKTSYLLNDSLERIERGHGVGVISPHADYPTQLAAVIPDHRAEDVVFVDFLNTSRPVGLNVLECFDPASPLVFGLTLNLAIGVFKKVWGATSWGPLLEDLLRNTFGALIYAQGYTLAEVPAFLEEQDFRSEVLKLCPNPQIVRFFRNNYDQLRPHEQADYRASTGNKIREFLVQPIVEAIVGQPTTSIPIRELMDQGKILIVPIPVGQLSESVVSLLGGILVGQILAAALSRDDIAEAVRLPFYLYVDEAQYFTTEDFATLVREARKFKVACTIATTSVVV